MRYLFLQPAINMGRSTAFWNVASNIDKAASFTTFWTNIRWIFGCYKKSALGAFPVSQTTIGTNVCHEPAVGCIATNVAYILFWFVFHFFYLVTMIGA
jgi:hypothetical protein